MISGDHSPAFEAVCDALGDAIGAERAVIPGRGHTIPSTGDPYNRALEAFMARGARARDSDHEYESQLSSSGSGS